MNLPTRQSMYLILCFLLLLVAAGCISDSTETHIEDTDVQRADPGAFEERFTYHEDGQYRINGTLQFNMPGEQDAEFPALMVCMYGSDGTLLNATNLGAVSAPSEVSQVTLTSDRRPRYIVVDHPRFEEYEFPNDPSISPLTIGWTNETVREHHQKAADVINEFEYERPSEPGECYQIG